MAKVENEDQQIAGQTPNTPNNVSGLIETCRRESNVNYCS